MRNQFVLYSGVEVLQARNSSKELTPAFVPIAGAQQLHAAAHPRDRRLELLARSERRTKLARRTPHVPVRIGPERLGEVLDPRQHRIDLYKCVVHLSHSWRRPSESSAGPGFIVGPPELIALDRTARKRTGDGAYELRRL